MLDELERLLAQATLGRLSCDGRNIFEGRNCVATRGRSSTDEEADARAMAAMKLLAAAVNALPALIRVARAAEVYLSEDDEGEWASLAWEFTEALAALRGEQDA